MLSLIVIYKESKGINMTEKRNIHALIEKEAPSLNNLLDPNDVKEFKELTGELRDTWTKKQVFRTETEMRMSVLQDGVVRLELISSFTSWI